MTDESLATDPLHRLSKIYTNMSECIEYDYTQYIEYMKQTEWNATYVAAGSKKEIVL